MVAGLVAEGRHRVTARCGLLGAVVEPGHRGGRPGGALGRRRWPTTRPPARPSCSVATPAARRRATRGTGTAPRPPGPAQPADAALRRATAPPWPTTRPPASCSSSAGTTARTYMNDTWAWTGTTWDSSARRPSPTGRYGASLAYDGSSWPDGPLRRPDRRQYVRPGHLDLEREQLDASSPRRPARPGATRRPSPTTPPAARWSCSVATAAAPWATPGTVDGHQLDHGQPDRPDRPRYGASLAYSPAIANWSCSGARPAVYDSDTGDGTAPTGPSCPCRPAPRPARWRPWPSTRPAARWSFSAAHGASYLGDTWQWSATRRHRRRARYRGRRREARR